MLKTLRRLVRLTREERDDHVYEDKLDRVALQIEEMYRLNNVRRLTDERRERGSL